VRVEERVPNSATSVENERGFEFAKNSSGYQ